MLRENRPLSPSNVDFYDKSKAVIDLGLAELNYIVPSGRIQNKLYQFPVIRSAVFQNSQEIRLRKAYRLGSTYCNKDGEQRPRLLKVTVRLLTHVLCKPTNSQPQCPTLFKQVLVV